MVSALDGTGASPAAAALLDWHVTQALPCWAERGFDPATGLFREAIERDGTPSGAATRCRVQARQIYVYVEAARLGWRDGAAMIEPAVEALLRVYGRGDGSFRHLAARDGAPVDETPYLYDQAFALFALGHASGLLGRPARFRTVGQALVAYLEKARRDPAGGYLEFEAGQMQLAANPHMHLLEAALAFMQSDPDEVWLKLADEVVSLCRTRFVDARTGALREHFAAGWAPAAGQRGRTIEPGHHYEWAWLLDRWSDITGGDCGALVQQLIDFAESHGQVAGRTISEVDISGAVIDGGTRIWPQTERIKAHCRLSSLFRSANASGSLSREGSIEALMAFFTPALPGLWFDRMDAEGKCISAAAPASSLYHIAGACSELAA